MWRSLYACLVRLHPRAFRERFADEMLWIFDQAAGGGAVAPLFADVLQSLLRQWILRPVWRPHAPAALVAAGATPFQTLETSGLPPGALLKGALISLFAFAGVFYCATHGGGNWEGMVQLFYTLEEKASMAPATEARVVEASAPEGLELEVRRVMLLDFNRDGAISTAERHGALAERYRDLLDRSDRNRDGEVTEVELRLAILWPKLQRAIQSNMRR